MRADCTVHSLTPLGVLDRRCALRIHINLTVVVSGTWGTFPSPPHSESGRAIRLCDTPTYVAGGCNCRKINK